MQARGIFVDPARVRCPKDKPRVENQVPYVRESWFDGETFTDIEDARRSAEHWCRDVAGASVHGTTRRVPRELFESVEKAAMRAPPDAPFDVPMWFEKAKVHPDHHIQVANALYSVPNRYLRKYVRVRADKTQVKIYFGTELIKVHPRKAPGGRSTDANDYPAEKAVYALRDVDSLIAKSKDKGVHIGIYAERLLGGPLPWTKMRQAYALLGLCENTARAASKQSARALWRSTSSTCRASPACSSRRPSPLHLPRCKARSCSSRCRASPDPRVTSKRSRVRARRRKADGHANAAD